LRNAVGSPLPGPAVTDGGSASEWKWPVAQRIETRLVDDLDGSTAAETVRFAFEGRDYEIDLSEENAAKLRDALAEFVASARRAGSGAAPGGRRAGAAGRPARRGSYDREHATAVREWARANGFEVSERGRIPSAVVEAYDKREQSAAEAGSGDAEADAAPARDGEKPKKGRPSVTDPFARQAAS
jgi:nucleoid-associated protein Lsr2